MGFESWWAVGQSFADFVAGAAPEHRPLWEGIYRRARLPEGSEVAPAGPLRLLALVEDWCVDTSSTIPYLARLVEATPGLELRLLRRDEHPDLMDRYLTNGSRAIPIVLALDSAFREVGRWGPYPEPLADWVRVNKPPALPRDEYLKGKRTWYARDRGETTLRELRALVAPGGEAELTQPSAPAGG